MARDGRGLRFRASLPAACCHEEVWNATNLSRRVRGICLRLFRAYEARIHLVYVEVPEPVLHAQNRARAPGARVPDAVLARLLDHWDVPDRTEADEVSYVVRDG